jgi:hypothetical protein
LLKANKIQAKADFRICLIYGTVAVVAIIVIVCDWIKMVIMFIMVIMINMVFGLLHGHLSIAEGKRVEESKKQILFKVFIEFEQI